MRFLYPLGLLGLIGVPLLILIYILRSKYNEQTVASTYLWTLSEKFFKRRNPLSGLTGIISLIMQILTVIFASLLIARPIFTVPQSASEYCFILDATGSMNMKNGQKTDFEKGKDYIEDMIDDARLGSSYTLIRLASDSEVVFENITDKKMAKEMLSEQECSDGTGNTASALAVAQKYFDENPSSLVYFVTDTDYEKSENLEIVNVGLQNAKNYALSEVSGELTEGLLTVNGSVISYSEDTELTLQLYVNGGKDVADKTVVSVKHGEPREVQLSCRVGSYDSYRLVIADKDDLPADNEFIGYNLESESSYSVLVVSETPFFMEAVLDSVTDSVVDVISPAEYDGRGGYGLYIFHSFTPDVLPDAAVWLINSTESVENSGFGIRGINELDSPAQIIRSNSTSTVAREMLDGVSGRSIYISEYVKYSGMYTRFTTLFSYESHPIIFAGVNALGNRQVVFAFDLHKSNLPISSDFAPLVANLLEYSCPDVLDRADYVCGETAQINVTANIDSVKTVSPDGEENYLDTKTDVQSLLLDKVGTYTISVSAAGKETLYKIYSSAPISESDPGLVGGDLSIVGEPGFEKTDGEYDPATLIFVLLAIVFTADWMVYCYEKYQLR